MLLDVVLEEWNLNLPFALALKGILYVDSFKMFIK